MHIDYIKNEKEDFERMMLDPSYMKDAWKKKGIVEETILDEKKFLKNLENLFDIKKDQKLLEENKKKSVLFQKKVFEYEDDFKKILKKRDPLNITSKRSKGVFTMYEFQTWDKFSLLRKYQIPQKLQERWYINFVNLEDMDVSGNVQFLLKMLNKNIKIFDTNVEDLPEDAFFPDNTKNRPMYLNLSGYKFLLKHKTSVKSSLLSNDLYSKVMTDNSNLKKDLKGNYFKKSFFFESFFLEKFRILRDESVYSLKSYDDNYYFIKLFYNKPDMLHDFRYKMSKSFLERYVLENRKWLINKNILKNVVNDIFPDTHEARKNLLNFEIPIGKVRNIKIDSKFNYIQIKENLYDFVTNFGNQKILKKTQNDIRNLLLQNKLVLEISKKFYKMSLQELQANWLEGNMLTTYVNSRYLNTQYYLKKNNVITWNTFYTQIESIVEPLNLNILNKNFYGNYINSAELHSNFLSNYKIKNNELPKSTHILLKKNYIIQLLNVYQKEEQSIINYILYKIKKEELKIMYKVIQNTFNVIFDNIFWHWVSFKKTIFYFSNYLIEELSEELLKIKQVKIIWKYYNLLNLNLINNSNNFIIIIYILFYCIISSILVVLIKSFIPKNLIYGIKLKKKRKLKEIIWEIISKKKVITSQIINKEKQQTKWESINEGFKFIEDIKKEDIERDLDNFLRINLKQKILDIKKRYNKKRSKNLDENKIKNIIYKDILKNIEKIDDINIENIKKLEIQRNLKKWKLNFKKNFFDPENRYIYSWESRYDKTYYENKNLVEKGIKKIQIYNKFEEKKKKDLKKNYIIFYKKFLFEKNLEKWENNTKFRLENPLEWYTIINSIFFKLKKLVEVFRRDKRYNHNRIIFWEDPTLDEWNKITYVYIIPKPFFNFFFVIKFIIGSIKLWNYSYWIQKWKQYVMYGVRTKMSYKELRAHLEKDWTLEWYKDNLDYGTGMYLKNMMKVAKKYNDIKKFPLNKEILEKKENREDILENIINLIEEEDKLKNINQYLISLDKIKLERLEDSFDKKFIDINKKLILDIEKKDPRKLIEQKIRYKYKDIIFKKKLEIEKEEYKLLKQSYTKRTYRDSYDKKKSLQYLEDIDAKNIKIIIDKKIALVEYERKLRDYNYEHNIIDEALDLKEAVFFESIKAYNKELSEAYLKFDDEAKQEKTQEQITENQIKTLYGVYDKYYPYYRKWTTMGARMNYILAQIIMIFTGWVDNFKRIRKNEYNIQNIFNIMWVDIVEYIYKMYWEFMIIFKEYEGLKKWGLNIKTILKFSLILTPILIYSIILYIILIIFFWWYFIYIKTTQIIINIVKKIYKNINIFFKKKIFKIFINILNIFKEIIYYTKYILNIFFILLKNLDTGNTILVELYYKFYNICAWMQRNIYFIKGAFILKYNENKSIKEGLYSIKKYLILKYNSYLEIKKKNNKKYFKIFILKKKENIKIKLELLIILLNIDFLIKKNKRNFLRRIYKYIIYPIFKLSWKDFYYYYKINIQSYEKYKNNLKNSYIKNILLLRKIKSWDLIKLILKNIFKLLILPFSYVIKYQQNKYVKNYKKGVQGFRDNPMYIVLDNPIKKISWKTKLHEILMKRKISKYLSNLLETQTHIVEMFFMYKIFEVKWTKKNYYQDFFWRKWYWYFKSYKKRILNWLIEYMTLIEESYQNFEEGIETQNWSLWEKCKYAYYTYKMYNHVMTRGTQRDISRNIFFYKRAKERDKLIRIYFIKGIINWISYITLNKVIFNNIKDLKNQKIKYKNIKYYIKNIKGTIHISGYIEDMPPQFWALIIIYNKYYRYLLKYKYHNYSYPKNWEENKDLEYKKDYKWRLSSPSHNYDIPFYDRRFIAADMNSLQFKDFVSNLANQPYDPLIRWILFLSEFGLTNEVLIDEGNKKFVENLKQDVWGDISLTHLLTYNKDIDEYDYEVKEFNRLVEGWDFLKVAEHTLERDKHRDYLNKFRNVKQNIILKNEDILEDILNKRRLRKAKMLHKALLRNKLKTPFELEEEREEENKKEYFYARKREFFEEMYLEKYWDWQAEYDADMIEDKYFNKHDLWDATYNAHSAEEFYLTQGKLVEYSHLIDHIVLLSFDETLEEIYSFLMFKVWKILEKDLNKKKKINYKHLSIDANILSRLNSTEHLEFKNIEIYDKITKTTIVKDIYEYKYPRIIWEALRIHHSYNYVENNLILMYYESGDIFTYQDKIEFNKDAVRYQRTDKYHEQEFLSKFLNILSERKKKLKNIKRIQINNTDKNKKLNFAFINNIKWNWEQWLIYNDIEKENNILNKNIIIFNERYNIWNLRRVPIRIKLPVMLEPVDDALSIIKDFLNNDDNFLSNGFVLMSSTINPVLRQSLEWEKCRVVLEKHFNKNIQELMLWIFTADTLNKEVLKVKKDYKFLLKNFIQNYNIFQKLYFLGLPHYSWDLIRYHEVWLGQEEFQFDKYFQLKQIEFLNHDPEARKIVEKLHNMFITKYNPKSFVYFFKYQFINNYIFPLCNILIFSNIIWLLKVLYYSPAEILDNNYLLFSPIFFIILSFYIRKRMKLLSDLNKGLEIYLYKYRSSNTMSLGEWQKFKLNSDRTKRAWIENFYDQDKIQEVFGSVGTDALISQRDPDWWRYHTYLTKDHILSKSQHLLFLSSILLYSFITDFWSLNKHLYRNSKWIWDYYRIDKAYYEEAKKNNQHVARGFHERIWLDDTWTRLEGGDNLFSKWYGDYYRKLRNISPRNLDYSNVGDAVNIDFLVFYKGWAEQNRILHYSTGFSDGNWVQLSKYLEKQILLEKQQKIDVMLKNWDKFIREIFWIYKKDEGKYRLDNKDREITRYDVRDYFKFLFKIKNKVLDWKSSHENGYGFYHKEIFEIKENFLSNRNRLRDFYFIKKDIEFEIAQKKEEFFKWKFGEIWEIHTNSNKNRTFVEFVQWVRDEMINYDIQNVNLLYSNFLIKLQEKIYPLIRQDLKRYLSKKDAYIFGDYYEKFLNKKKEIYIAHKECFETGKSLDIKILLEITDKEKHYHNFCYHIVKYKLERIIILKKKFLENEVLKNPKDVYKIYNKVGEHYKELLQEQYFGTWYFPLKSRFQYGRTKLNEAITILNKFTQSISKEIPMLETVPKFKFEDKKFKIEIEKDKVKAYLSYLDELLSKHEKFKELSKFNNIDIMLVKFLRKKGRYIKNINTEISKSEIVEYKAKLLINFFKEKINFWIFIENFSIKLDIIELFMILVQLILKFLG